MQILKLLRWYYLYSSIDSECARPQADRHRKGGRGEREIENPRDLYGFEVSNLVKR